MSVSAWSRVKRLFFDGEQHCPSISLMNAVTLPLLSLVLNEVTIPFAPGPDPT